MRGFLIVASTGGFEVRASCYQSQIVEARDTSSVDVLQRIRAAVRRIPRGKVSTYGAVAEAAGVPRGARVTVRALRGATDLPWFRVVAAGGRIALPGEAGYDQRLRLEMEGVKFSGKKVRMKDFEHRFAIRAAKRPAGRAGS